MRCGLIGDPVAQSLSPVMHGAAFAALGLDAIYESWHTPVEDLESRVTSIRGSGILGANVTVPHKQAVMTLCDEIAPVAAAIGAVNTLIPVDGRLRGENTDAYGFVQALGELPSKPEPRVALVLGAGGAARAVSVALGSVGVNAIRIANRTHARASALAAALTGNGMTGIGTIDWDRLETGIADVDLLVNATSIGWHGDESPIAAELLDKLPAGASVFDLTYRETALIRLARARDLAAADGLAMLVHQGARSFELWTGQAAPVDVMRRAVEAEQRRRSDSAVS